MLSRYYVFNIWSLSSSQYELEFSGACYNHGIKQSSSLAIRINSIQDKSDYRIDQCSLSDYRRRKPQHNASLAGYSY